MTFSALRQESALNIHSIFYILTLIDGKKKNLTVTVTV